VIIVKLCSKIKGGARHRVVKEAVRRAAARAGCGQRRRHPVSSWAERGGNCCCARGVGRGVNRLADVEGPVLVEWVGMLGDVLTSRGEKKKG
jgi:hypothetical protein